MGLLEKTKEELVSEIMELRSKLAQSEYQESHEPPFRTSPATESTSEPESAHSGGVSGQLTANPFLEGKATQTIDLSKLFSTDPSDTGTFDLGSGIWRTTFGKVLQALPISTFLIDESLKIVALNEACRRIVADYKMLDGKPFADLFVASYTEQAQALLRQIYRDRKPREWEAVLDIDNCRMWVRLVFRPIRIAEERFLLALVDDLTSEKKEVDRNIARLEEMERRVRERTQELTEINERLVLEVAQREATERALRETGQKYRDLAELLPQHVFEVDKKGFFTFSNRTGSQALGYSAEELEGCEHMLKVLTPTDHPRAVEDFKKLRRGERISGIEYTLARKDGSSFEVMTHISPLMIGGEFTGARGVAVDISDLKQVQQQLSQLNNDLERLVEERSAELLGANEKLREEVAQRRSLQDALEKEKEKLSGILEALEDGVNMVDQYYSIQFINRALLKDLGPVKGKKCYEYFHDRSEPCPNCHMPRVIEGRSTCFDWYCFKNDKTYELRDSAVHNADGSIWKVEIFRDITDRKRAEAALTESEEKFRNLVERANDGIVIVQDGVVKYANPAAARAMGYEYLEELDMPFTNYVHPEARAIVEETYKKRMAGETVPNIYDTALIRKNGEKILVEVNAGVIEFSGQPADLIIMRDVTERRKFEAQLEESELKFRSVVENAQEGITVIQGGFLKYANPSSSEIMGYTHEELFSKPFLDFIHPDDRASVEDRYRRRLAGESFQDTFLFRIVAAQGIVKWIEADSVNMDWSGEASILTLWRDVTARREAEEALRQSEARFRALFENMINGVAVYRPIHEGLDFVFVDLNKAAEKIDRIDGEDIIGKPVSEVFPGVKKFGLFEVFQRVWRTGKTENYPVAHYKDDRIEGWRDNVVYRLPTGDIVAVYSDESEKKKAEDARRESESRYRAIVDNAQESMFLKDRSLKYTHVNPAMESLFGLPGSVLVGKTDTELFGEDAVAATLLEDESVLQGQTIHRESTRTIRGVPMTFDVVKVPISDSSRRVVGICGIVRDVTEKRRAQEQISRSEARYRALFNNSRDGIYITSRDGTIEAANPAFCRMFGLDERDPRGLSVLDLYNDANDRVKFQQHIEERGSVGDYELELVTKDGRRIDCLITASVRKDHDGRIVGYEGNIRDVTDRKVLERQLFQARKMEAIGTLAGGVAHDFNNLLQVVLGYTNVLILQGDCEPQDLEKLETIRKAAKDGGELVRRLLTFSRQVESELRPIDMNELLQRSHDILRRTIPRMVKIKLSPADDLKTVNADPVQMEQVLLNVALNADHAMPEGGKLTISTENVILDADFCKHHLDVHPGEYVLLKITDTGHGMEREILEHIFEPFFTTKGPGEGTGLGLAGVYGIVRNHGGHIVCESEPGQGTTFSIYFPAVASQASSDTAPASESTPSSGTETILVVDDEERIRRVVDKILHRWGYTVFTAENGEHALAIYREKKDRIDLVILDLIMPGMGGQKCLEEIFRINPKAQILVASGRSMPDAPPRAPDDGSLEYITKPFDVMPLLGIVRKMLDKKCVQESRAYPSEPFTRVGYKAEGNNSGNTEQSTDESVPVEKIEIGGSPRHLKILVIDDRETYLRMLGMGLTQFGQIPIPATSGEEGVRIFQETPVDLVICDLEMPGLDGWEVAERIKEICRKRNSPRPHFILLTGRSDMEDMLSEEKNTMADRGVDAILGKPIDIPDILKAAETLMRKDTGKMPTG